jgi:biotin carboxylase
VLRSRLAAHWRVDDCLDPGQIVWAARGLAERIGPTERLLGTLEELQVPLAEARQALGVPGMSVEAARNFREKSRMKSVLDAAGLPCARHRLASSREEAWAFAQNAGFPLVVKPPAGAGARNTFRVDDADRLRQALEVAPPSADRPTLVEEFVLGDEHSFDSVCIEGRPAWHSISRYYPTPLEVLENPWIQWCVVLPRNISGPEYDPIRDAGFRALQALGMRTGLSHMEWFRRRDGSIAISEVAARPPGAQFTTLISYAHGFDLYEAWARLMVFGTFDPPPRQWAVGVAFLRGQGRGRVKAIHGVDRVAPELGPITIEVKLPREGQSPSGTYEGDGYVVVRHADTATVERALSKLVSSIRVELG